MKLIHNSRNTAFRTPFGAVEAGTDVTLTLHVEDADPADLDASLRTWIDGEGERIIPMERTADGFSVTLPCPEPAIVWYTFIVRAADGSEVRVGAREGATGGEAVTYDRTEVPSFQLTVYRHRATRPAWYENGMVYQIFPDRCRRDARWRERALAEIDRERRGPGKHLVEDWNTPPVYDRDESGAIRSWDFYGGSLEGIREDLERLQEMGVTAIYLNPIFEAASNHRYDTGNYLNIDPILGTEEDFRALCDDARAHGISIILDGVFNHTGDDSLYFNRFDNYPGEGAWNHPDSPWRDAYHFHEDGTYDSWWGIGNMPALNEASPHVQELLLGEDGVIRTWLRAGARGWRLDVADELTDGLIERIKAAVLEECPDGLLLGEVWEDASNKISYGNLRRYLLGDEIDSAMNYPFRDMVLAFLLGDETAGQAAERIMTLRENYPREALACALNLLGSHDRPRIASILGGGVDESSLPEAERGRWRLDEQSMGLAKGRFWLATLMQMTFPGVPSIYYGDEFALEGLSDPGNRRTLPLPEDVQDRDMLTMIQNASAVRRALPLFVDGDLSARALAVDVLCIERTADDGSRAQVLINRSLDATHTVRVPVGTPCATDLISGSDLAVDADESVEVTLWPLGSAVVYGHAAVRLQKPMEPGAGVLCHITSLPRDDGRPGTLGSEAFAFVDRIAAMGMRYWQVLPVNPTDSFGSPYAGPSAFAGNPALLAETPAELEEAYCAFCAADGFESDEWRAFARANEEWLEPYCAFMAVKDAEDGASRHEWPEELKRYDVALLEDPRFAERARYHGFVQLRFDQEWRTLRTYARERGVQIVGDIPMYVSDDSADAWSEPSMFNLDEDGMPTEIAGTPPDRFSATGQVWGNPTYRWDVMEADGYVWWLARLRRMCSLYDRVRLDHFLGFHNYFSIPAHGTGADGRWLPGPGMDLFERMRAELGPLPFIAEDLGILTPGVRTLMCTCGFPGMDVLEFADYDIRERIAPRPGNILYTSTHDTTTLPGMCTDSFCGGDAAAGRELAAGILRRALESDAEVVIMPLQDLLGLGNEARMNVPGVANGNWSWQATPEQLEAAQEPATELLRATGRAAGDDASGACDTKRGVQ